MSALVHSRIPPGPGLIRWKHGKPRDRAAIAIAAVDVDNLVGIYTSFDDGIKKIRRAAQQVQAMIADIAHDAQVFAFVQVHRPRPIADAIDELSHQYGFTIVHCPRNSADGTDDVDAHMKRFLRHVSCMATHDIPVVIFSGDHTFAEEAKGAGQTRRMYVGSCPEALSRDLSTTGRVRGIARLIPERSADEKLAILFGTHTEPQGLDGVRDVLVEPTWTELWQRIQVGKQRLLACHRAFRGQRYKNPQQGLAAVIGGDDTRLRAIAPEIAELFLKHGVVDAHQEEESCPGRPKYRLAIRIDHPFFEAWRDWRPST